MSGFNQFSFPVGRKEYRCEYCWWHIPKGEKHARFVGTFEGEFQDWRMHEECRLDFSASGEDIFSPGDADPPERIRAAGREAHRE